MAKDSFKVKKSLNIKPTDPATLSNSEVGDIVIDSTDNNKLKTYNDSSNSFVSVSSVGSLDTLLAEDFETTLAADFISGNAASPDTVPTGSFGGTLADETSNQLSGVRSLKYTMNATAASSDNDFFLNGTDIALAVKQRGNFIGINFYYTYNGDDDDIRFFVLDQDDNELTQSDEYIKSASTATRFSTSVFVPSASTGLRYGFQVVTGNSSKVFIVDDIEFSTNPFVYKNLVETASVRLHTSNGFGSTANKIRRYSNIAFADSSGSYTLTPITASATSDYNLFTVTSSAANGTAITFNRKCYITATFSMNATSGFWGGLTLNSSNLTTSVTSLTATEVLTVDYQTISTGGSSATWSGWVAAGDVIRPHTNGITGGTPTLDSMSLIAQAESEHVVTPAKSSDTEINYLSADVTATTDPISDLTFSNLEIGAKYLLIGHFELWTQNANSTMVVEADHDGSVISKVIMDSDADAATVKNTMTMSRVFTATATTLTFSATETGTASVRGDGTAGETYVELTKLSSNFLAAVPVQQTCYLRDVKAVGTNAGTSSSNTLHTRTLNTKDGDCSWVTLGNGTTGTGGTANQFTLSSGKYEIEASAPSMDSHATKIYLYNVSDSSLTISGRSGWRTAGDDVNYYSTLQGNVEITTNKTFEIKHWIETGKSGNGLGYSGGAAHASDIKVNEIYTEVKITKIK